MSEITIYKNILLIDDDEDDQEIFITAIQKLSTTLNCTMIGSASEALEMLASGETTTEIIFLDLNMPIMSGQQFLIEIKKITKLASIPVIIFSTSSHPATIAETKKLGAFTFITKPNKIIELVAILSDVLFSKTI